MKLGLLYEMHIIRQFCKILVSVSVTSLAYLTLHSLAWSQDGDQQSRDVRQPTGIATSRVAHLRQLLFIHGEPLKTWQFMFDYTFG